MPNQTSYRRAPAVIPLVAVGCCALYTVATRQLLLYDASLPIVLAQQLAALAFWFYLAGLRHVRASVAGAFLPLVPVFGVAAGYLIGERLAGRQWVGAVVVVAATATMAFQQARIADEKPSSAIPTQD